MTLLFTISVRGNAKRQHTHKPLPSTDADSANMRQRERMCVYGVCVCVSSSSICRLVRPMSDPFETVWNSVGQSDSRLIRVHIQIRVSSEVVGVRADAMAMRMPLWCIIIIGIAVKRQRTIGMQEIHTTEYCG